VTVFYAFHSQDILIHARYLTNNTAFVSLKLKTTYFFTVAEHI